MFKSERRRYVEVPNITQEELEPDFEFRYQVWGERGYYGDFPRQFEFQSKGKWLVAARVLEVVEIGAVTEFKVIFDSRNRKRLQKSEGVINWRPDAPDDPPGWYSRYPIEEGFATTVSDFEIKSQISSNGRHPNIPARNIERGTLKKVDHSLTKE